jgi:hypothetical protein
MVSHRFLYLLFPSIWGYTIIYVLYFIMIGWCYMHVSQFKIPDLKNEKPVKFHYLKNNDTLFYTIPNFLIRGDSVTKNLEI